MPLFFFHTRDDDAYLEDDVGIVLPGLEEAKIEAARSLAELAKDVIPGSQRRTLIVEVRDSRQLVMETRLEFEVIVFVAE